MRLSNKLSLVGLVTLALTAPISGATNETLSASFQKTAGYAGISVRIQDSSNKYTVQISEDHLQFLKTEAGIESTLGSTTIPATMAYDGGENWKINVTASGNVIFGSLTDQNNVEVTSGTVFDRSFAEGTSSLTDDGNTVWGPLSTEVLSQYVTAPAELLTNYDVVIAGAGTAGSIAAIQAARLGAKVLVVEESDWIGGQMAAAAVASMDEGNDTPSVGVSRNSPRERGLYKEFVQNANHLYGTMGLSTDTCYIAENHFGLEPRVAQALLYEMFQDVRTSSGAVLDVVLETSVTEVLKSGNLVTGVDLLINTPGGSVAKTISSKILMDATEMGDILPLAGARYRVGTWISDDDHTSATVFPPIQDFTWPAVIKHYSGGVPAGLMVDIAPTGYSKYYFEGALDNPEPYESSSPWSWERFVGYRGMPNSEDVDSTIMNPWAAVTKTHTNFGANDVHIDVRDIENLESRQYKEYLLKLQTLKLLYYIQHDMTVPIDDWTVSTDEGYDTPYNRAQNAALITKYPDLALYEDILNQFPPMAYARESRRMIGVHTIRAREIDRRNGPEIFPTSVAVGDYGVDLHGDNSPSALESDLDNPEDLDAIGFAGNKVGPFTIPFESFIPETLDGFLAAEKNISQSRLVNGATRLQPSTMLIGQAAGAIAAIAVREDKNPRDLNPAAVQKTLLDAGDVLYAAKFDAHKFPRVTVGSELWKSLQLGLLHGIVQLSDTNLILDGWNIVAGGSGSTGWQLNEDEDYQFAGTTGITTYDGKMLNDNSATTATDYTVSSRFNRPDGSGTIGLVGRLTSSGNFYHARIYFGALQLYKWVGNAASSLGSVAVDYVNGQTWTISMKFEGDQITASLYDADGVLNKSITVDDTSHTHGVAGFRAQPGTGKKAIYKDFTMVANDPAHSILYYNGFNGPVNVATDPLTRGDMAIHLARYFDLKTSAPVITPTYADVSATHTAFLAIEALNEVGVHLSISSDPLLFNPDAIATRADLATALVMALEFNPATAATIPYFTDVLDSHPAFSYIQLIAENNIGAAIFLQNETTFSPDSLLTIADSINLYADLLINPPPKGSGLPPASVGNWELY